MAVYAPAFFMKLLAISVTLH